MWIISHKNEFWKNDKWILSDLHISLNEFIQITFFNYLYKTITGEKMEIKIWLQVKIEESAVFLLALKGNKHKKSYNNKVQLKKVVKGSEWLAVDERF